MFSGRYKGWLMIATGGLGDVWEFLQGKVSGRYRG